MNLQDDFHKLAEDDEFGRKLQDIKPIVALKDTNKLKS